MRELHDPQLRPTISWGLSTLERKALYSHDRQEQPSFLRPAPGVLGCCRKLQSEGPRRLSALSRASIGSHCRRKAIHFDGSSNVFPVPLMREDSLAPNYGAGGSECNTEV
jgi:hypothetical protein